VKLARLALLATVAVAVGCKSGRRPANVEPKPLRPASDKMTIPALEADDDDSLTFAIETTQATNPRGRRLRLLLGGGEATLTLLEPSRTKDGDFVFGNGELRSTDRTRGAAFLAAVARWFGQPPPPAPAAGGPLEPLPITYAVLGTEGDWECNKLFFEDGSRDAELFLNVRRSGKQARFVEKDDEYRKPLLAMLATVLRDGKAPRGSRPEIAGAAPLVASLSPIAGSDGVGEPEIWMGGVWIAALAGDGAKQKVLYWNSLEKDARRLAEVTGSVSKLAPAPRGDRVALLILHPKQAGSVSSEDPGDLLVAPMNGDDARALMTSSDDFTVGMLSQPVWSPDGTMLAIDGRVAGKPPRASQTRVYDAAGGRLLASTPAEVGGPVPRRWDRDTLILRRWNDDGEQTLRWRPGKAGPVVDHRAATTLRSPDGRYTVAFHGASVDISGPGGRRRFDAKTEGDRAAVGALQEDPDLVAWLGGTALLLRSDEPMALDLATAKLHYLFANGDLQFVSASPDGARVVARDREKRLLWGAVAR
jgi:hypothetical protein